MPPRPRHFPLDTPPRGADPATPCVLQLRSNRVQEPSNVCPLKLLDIKLVNIPQRVRIQDRWLKIADSITCPDQNVRAYQAYHRQILSHDFLHAIVESLPLCVIE